MKTNRCWIELVTLCVGIACAIALLLAILGAAAESGKAEAESGQTVEAPASEQQTFEGMVTCTQCGAKHKAAIGKSASDCARACVHGGAQFALIDGDKTYLLVGEVAVLKRLAGERVQITGTLNGSTITVTSASVG